MPLAVQAKILRVLRSSALTAGMRQAIALGELERDASVPAGNPNDARSTDRDAAESSKLNTPTASHSPPGFVQCMIHCNWPSSLEQDQRPGRWVTGWQYLAKER